MFVSQWGSAQLSDDTPPCSVRIFLTQMRLTSQTCRRRFSHQFGRRTANVNALSSSLQGGKRKVILPGSLSAVVLN